MDKQLRRLFFVSLLMVVVSMCFSKQVVSVHSNDALEEPVAPEISVPEILNFLNNSLTHGTELAPLDLLFTLDSYDLLGIEIPNRSQIIEYLDSIQSDEGTWYTNTTHYVPLTAQVLMFYNRSGVKPVKSLDPFFSRIDTWEKVNTHVQEYDAGNYWGGLWGYINCYLVYKGIAPPWEDDLLAAVSQGFNSWAYDNHQRTHLMGNLAQLRRPVPRIDEVFNITLQQQAEDGSWSGGSGSRTEAETVFTIQVLRFFENQTTVPKNLIDACMTKALQYVRACYKTIDYQGTTYSGFVDDPSETIPTPVATGEGIWALLEPESDVWIRWFVSFVVLRFNVTWEDQNYTIDLMTNSTVTESDFNFTARRMHLDVTVLPGTLGYCNFSIPRELMWCDSLDEWSVNVSGSPMNDLTITENSTSTILYFVYDGSTIDVSVVSTHILPEFTFPIILCFLMAISFLLIGLTKLQRKTQVTLNKGSSNFGTIVSATKY